MKILLVVVAVVAGLLLLGAIISALKWLLILAGIVLIAGLVTGRLGRGAG